MKTTAHESAGFRGTMAARQRLQQLKEVWILATADRDVKHDGALLVHGYPCNLA
jgi:hypothetical protein